ncbi:hypothetical protein BN79_014 [Yersinia phage phiR2-01]|uniref:Uncharacterized protein n=1 Tax=Yersinia phage phiR2-01 TaxID=1206557 RepID=I7LEC3_9CAUD|nr:hypothetical protein BN79_014 [Yersinia phage phiR2-01]CCI88442.1 hypothetical protein BN79_014 [Yersinia phage phiR2-01]
MEIVLIVLTIAAVAAFAIGLNKTQRANKILDDQIRLKREVSDQKAYIDDIIEIAEDPDSTIKDIRKFL